MTRPRAITKGMARPVWALIGGLGVAAAVTLAPVAVGVAQAAPPVPKAPTVVTNGTWHSASNTSATTHALAECPVKTNGTYNYATLPVATGATWIWANKGQAGCKPTTTNGPGTVTAGTVTLSTTFTVTGDPQGATLTLAADNGATVWINKTPTPVATLSATSATPTNFKELHTFTFTRALVSGRNEIRIEGTNAPNGGSYNPAGVLAKLTVRSTSLKFVTQPNATQTNHTIRSGVDSTGTAIKVEVVWTTGTLDTTFKGTVKISLVGTPATSTLSGGTAMVVTGAGVATFSALKVDHAGSYRLVATATPTPGTSATPPTPSTSTRFNVDTKLTQCTSLPPCTTSGSATGNSVHETTTSAAGYIALGFGGAPTFSCGKTKPLTGKYVATVDVLSSKGTPIPQTGTTWTVTYTIAKTLVQTTGPEGASKWQICFADTTPFTAVTGRITTPTALATGAGTVYYYVGLLRTCSKSVTAPCIESRHKTNAGQEVITVKSAGDSYVRP